MEQSLREAGPPPYACAVASGRAAESLGWEGREQWAGREPPWRRRSATPKARAALSAGFGSGSVSRGGRGQTLRTDGAGSPGAPQLRGGEWPDVPGLPFSAGGVPTSSPVAASPCAYCLAGPGPRPPRPGVRSCAAFASRLLRSRGTRVAPAAASPFVLLAALRPFPPFPALRAAFLSARLLCLRSRLLPRRLRRGSTRASSPGPWLAGPSRAQAVTAPGSGRPRVLTSPRRPCLIATDPSSVKKKKKKRNELVALPVVLRLEGLSGCAQRVSFCPGVVLLEGCRIGLFSEGDRCFLEVREIFLPFNFTRTHAGLLLIVFRFLKTGIQLETYGGR